MARIDFNDDVNKSLSERIALMRNAVKAAEELNNLTSAELSQIAEIERKQAQLEKFQRKRIADARTSVDKQKQLTASVGEQLSGLSSISSIYTKLTNAQSTQLKTASNLLKNSLAMENADESKYELVQNLLEGQSKLNAIQQQLASSDPGDTEKQQALRDSYASQVDQLNQQLAIAKGLGQLTSYQAGLLDRLTRQNVENLEIAERYATVSGETKTRIESQIEAYDKMKNALRGTLDTVRMTLLTPQAMIVGASVAAGKFANAMGDVNKQTGMFMASTAGLSFVFDDAAGTLSQMAKLSGDVNKATFMAQLNTNVLATSMGIGGEEAATLVNAFGNLQGLSQETGEQMVSMVGNTARMSGVLPSQVMKDMAGASEEMALYSKGTGENFAMAAIQASKLGVSIATTAKMADNLLDFETSIEKELEASAMLGRDLNLSKARELAYAEDIEGATAEVLKQVGGIDEFNKMDVYQKKAVADALGISVAELKQMAANQENLNTTTGLAMSYFGKLNDYTRAIGEKFTGPIASGVTFFLGELIRAKITAAALNGGQGLGGFGRRLFGRGGGGAPTAPSGPGTPPPTTSAPASNPGQQASSMTRFNPAQVLAGAAALLIVAAAVYVFAKAMQEFASVPASAVLLGIVSLLALVGALALVGSIMMSGVGAVAIIAGAAAMLIIAAAMWVLGKALQEIAKVDPMALIQMGAAILAFGLMVAPLGLLFTPLMLAAVSMIALGGASLILGAGLIVLGAGLVLIGKGFSAITSGLPLLVEQMGSLAQIDFLPILGLAGAFTALAFALGLVATMGLAALPVLAAVGLVAGGAAALMGGGGGEEKGGMLDEIKGLRADLAAGKIAVYMDGQLVTSKVANVASKNPVT